MNDKGFNGDYVFGSDFSVSIIRMLFSERDVIFFFVL